MTWARLDDGFHGHPKTAGTSLAAIGLLALAISYSADYLTDGLLPATFLRHRAHGRAGKAALRELVEKGWLEPVGDDYTIHDFLDFNPSRAEVEEKRGKERSKKQRQRSTPTLWTGASAADVSPGDSPRSRESGSGTSTTPATTNGDQPQDHARPHLPALVSDIQAVFAALGLSIDEITVANAVARFPGVPHLQVARGCAEACKANPDKPPGLTLHRWFEREAANGATASAGRSKAQREADGLAAIERVNGGAA